MVPVFRTWITPDPMPVPFIAAAAASEKAYSPVVGFSTTETAPSSTATSGTPAGRSGVSVRVATSRVRLIAGNAAWNENPPGTAHDPANVIGADARRDEIDALISGRLAEGWTLERLDRPMRAILRAGAYELIARPDVPVGSVISEYVDVAHAFYDKRESGFVNGLLDAIAKEARQAKAQ